MKIIHLSNTDSGGAIELHAAMLEAGLDSSMLVKGHDLGGVPHIYKIDTYHHYLSNIGGYLSKAILPPANPKLTMFSFPLVGASLHKDRIVKQADVIYLHFVAQASFLSLTDIHSILKLGKPVVFVTRDMWPITGGCHYPLDCNGYTTDCNHCPYYRNQNTWLNWPALQLLKKAKIYNKYTNLVFVGISKWNQEILTKGKATSMRKAFAIGNAINTNLFQKIPREEARKKLGLPLDIPMIGFGARSTRNYIKGFDYLISSIEKLKNTYKKDFAVATIGSGSLTHTWANTYELGYITDREKLALYYNALDVYVSPAIAEAFGNTVAEAMACGTPVVGFKTGGLQDIIDHKTNGYLAQFKDSEDLARGIKFMLLQSIENSETLRDLCKTKIEREFSREVICHKHIAMLKEAFAIE